MKTPLYVLLMLISANALACDVKDVLPTLRPKAVWTLSGDTLAGLKWLDKTQPAPTQQEIDAACAAVVPEVSLQDQIKALEARVRQLEALWQK